MWCRFSLQKQTKWHVDLPPYHIIFFARPPSTRSHHLSARPSSTRSHHLLRKVSFHQIASSPSWGLLPPDCVKGHGRDNHIQTVRYPYSSVKCCIRRSRYISNAYPTVSEAYCIHSRIQYVIHDRTAVSVHRRLGLIPLRSWQFDALKEK